MYGLLEGTVTFSLQTWAMQELSPSSHSIRDKTKDESTKGNLGSSCCWVSSWVNAIFWLHRIYFPRLPKALTPLCVWLQLSPVLSSHCGWIQTFAYIFEIIIAYYDEH
jgi:hypothetical protein